MPAYDWPIDTSLPVMRIVTPKNVHMCGVYGMSFAYYSLKERLPIILTKVIDQLSRDGTKIKREHNATDDDIVCLIRHITKLKSDLVTNKPFEKLQAGTPEAALWNSWLDNSEYKTYFTHLWVFSECYVYRRLWEGCELSKNLKNFDYFAEQKDQSFQNSVELMCIVAERLREMIKDEDQSKRKANFVALLKVCLWSNKCDLSLSNGEQVGLSDGPNVIDPFLVTTQLKDKLLVDDSEKIYDGIVSRAESFAKALQEASKDANESKDQPETEPCPAKMPQTVALDIICDNSGYELFTDLCVAHYLIATNIVKKIRFHVKKLPWFVSDVTPRDFKYVISSCATANYNREVPPKTEGESPIIISSKDLNEIGAEWTKFLEDGTFEMLAEPYWTYPHIYRVSRGPTAAPVGRAVAALFKGDLNYRKLLGERNWGEGVSFEQALEGFHPCPIIALRTVKADLIAGLPAGAAARLSAIDARWMETGDYGVIQYCGKCDPAPQEPCELYGTTCDGEKCS
ncbi:damage-control phosphatase ARMT1-like isoform X2 [Aricia agestis]|uniref:damage-control phosphatase ARMT1-like isoform X2 n=1 Tax=Aricia agestis TaxID=91739 RepID=UPI001C204153|nr:damage-control phosphatase ARMT1-like isoform X2 [Aricia agestis]